MTKQLLCVVAAGMVAAGAGFWLLERSALRAVEGPAKKAGYVHAVIFYLKKDSPANAKADLIADCRKLLAKIPSVRDVKAGLPAEKVTPNVSVTDYSVGLLVLFDNQEGLDAYLKHALHDEFVARHGKHIEKVLVYDFPDAS